MRAPSRAWIVGTAVAIALTAVVTVGLVVTETDSKGAQDPPTRPIEAGEADDLLVPGPNGQATVPGPPDAGRAENHVTGGASQAMIEQCFESLGGDDLACRAMDAASEGRLEPGDYTDEELAAAVERAEGAAAK